MVKEQSSMTMMNARLRGLSQLTAGHQRERTSPLNRLTSPRERKHNRQSDVTPRRARKRRSAPSDRDKLTPQQVSIHLLQNNTYSLKRIKWCAQTMFKFNVQANDTQYFKLTSILRNNSQLTNYIDTNLVTVDSYCIKRWAENIVCTRKILGLLYHIVYYSFYFEILYSLSHFVFIYTHSFDNTNYLL